MVRLVPMSEQEFEDFMIISVADQAQGHIISGEWKAEAAQENMEKLCSQFLPHGLATPNHLFFTIEDLSTNTKVGGLWYRLVEQSGERFVYVMDIQIYSEYRRRGFGSLTFLAMEEKVREMGVTTIKLHVFTHNTPARAMYVKLGYSGTQTEMSKEINVLEKVEGT